MKLRIESDGTTAGTLVKVDGTDEYLDGVVSVDWRCAMGPQGQATLATATLVLDAVEVDVEGTAAAEFMERVYREPFTVDDVVAHIAALRDHLHPEAVQRIIDALSAEPVPA